MTYTFSTKVVTTKVKHQCRCCGEVIQPGEQAQAWRGVTDAGVSTCYLHRECAALSRSWTEDYWDCTFPGDVKRPVADGIEHNNSITHAH